MSFSTSSTGANKEDPLLPIWNEIWARRPILEDIMQHHGSTPLYDYTKDFFEINASPRLDARKAELIEVVEGLLKDRLGADTAHQVARQLAKLPLVSTADHHGPIVHPFWVAANIVTGLRYLEMEDPDIRFLPVFSFAGVSLNNHTYPRGILFHGEEHCSKDVVKLSLFGDKEKMSTVYNTRPYTKEDASRAIALLAKKVREGEVNSEIGASVKGILEDIFLDPEVLKIPDYSAQITWLNARLWPKLFHPVTPKTPDLVYLEIETLVRELLLQKHLGDPQSLIYKVLFDPQFQPLFEKYFNNIPGAFSLEKGWGTYLFWALDDKNHRVRLSYKDGRIVSEFGTCDFALEPNELRKALEERKIFPSMVLCYLIVALYYGMKCLGGFCQVSDLTKTKEAWQSFMREIGYLEEAEALEPVQTKELGGDGMVLAYLESTEGHMTPATGIDLILQKKPTNFERYVKLTKNITFGELMNPLVLEVYGVMFSSEERNPEFMKYTPEAVLEMTGMCEKLLKLE